MSSTPVIPHALAPSSPLSALQTLERFPFCAATFVRYCTPTSIRPQSVKLLCAETLVEMHTNPNVMNLFNFFSAYFIDMDYLGFMVKSPSKKSVYPISVHR